MVIKALLWVKSEENVLERKFKKFELYQNLIFELSSKNVKEIEEIVLIVLIS